LSSYKILSCPKVNYGFNLGIRGSILQSSPVKRQFSFGLKFFAPKTIKYSSLAIAKDTTNTTPITSNIESQIRISYHSFDISGVIYILGHENGQLNIYTSLGVSALLAYYKTKHFDFNETSYKISRNDLFDTNPNSKDSDVDMSGNIGIGIEKKYSKLFFFFEINYNKIFNADLNKILFEKTNVITLNCGLRLFKI
jgi:hypothetical protein